MPSGADDSSRRSNFWSYLNFGTSSTSSSTTAITSGLPRRRSVNASSSTTAAASPPSSTLPHMRSSAGFSSVSISGNADDPFEKPDRHVRHSSNNGSAIMGEVRARMGNSSRLRLIKAVALMAFVMLLFFVLAPGDRSSRMREYIPKVGSTTYSKTPSTGKTPTTDGKKIAGFVSEEAGGAGGCTKPYSSDKPLKQYVLMIDAGSTGSRIHVYRFNNCGPTPELEDEFFKQTAKKEGGSGLSAYPDDPEAAAESLDVLLDAALKEVPKDARGCSPIAVKATAGLRKIGEQKSNAILTAVRKRLETNYPFPVVSDEEGGVQVMDGEDEAVYAWVTANYLLKKIGGVEETPTAAVLDLGGGSTQIVFEPTYPDAPDGGMPERLAKGDHRHELQFGGRDFTLYQHSYLGFGLMEARDALHKLVAQSANSGKKSKKRIPNPCLIPGTEKDVEVELTEGGSATKITMIGPSLSEYAELGSNAAQCRAFIEKMLDKDAECKLKPCAFQGVHQPSFPKTFATQDIYLLSYFYDRAAPLGMPESFSISELKALAGRVCAGEEAGAWKDFAAIEGALDELHDRPETCLDLSFMVTLLTTGYGMPHDREVKVAKKIDERELGWCLGASLPLLSEGSGWKCKLSKNA